MEELDESSVIRLIGRIVQAWNKADLTTVCEAYAHDAVFVSNTGLVRGREAILTRYRAQYDSPFAMPILSLQLLQLFSSRSGSQSSPNMASAVLEWQLTHPGGQRQNGFSLIVLVQRPPDILIIQDASV